jgi:hypothetical protein
MEAILKNLKDQTDQENKTIMYCPRCFQEFSANKGDYFMIDNPEYKFICSCGNPLLLVTKETIYKQI